MTEPDTDTEGGQLTQTTELINGNNESNRNKYYNTLEMESVATYTGTNLKNGAAITPAPNEDSVTTKNQKNGNSIFDVDGVDHNDDNNVDLPIPLDLNEDVSNFFEIENLTLRNDAQDKLCRNEWKFATQTTRVRNYVHSKALMLDSKYRINPKKYCGLLRGYVRQDWNTVEDNKQHGSWEELKPSWTELFFDLMFVAAIIHISSEVSLAFDKQSWVFIIQVFAQFGLLQLSWFECVLYESRFRMNQKIDGILRAVYMLFVLAMGLSIQDEEIFHKIFLISYILSKSLLFISFLKVSLIPRAKNHAIFMILEKVISIITCIFLLMNVNYDLNNNLRRSLASYDDKSSVNAAHIEMSITYTIIFISLYVFSYIYIQIGVHINIIRHLGINIPVNVPHVADRLGEFLLVVLGETIIAIMIQHVDIDKEPYIQYVVTISSFIICYCCGKLYFECQPSEEDIHHGTKNHAMTTTVWKARIYGYSHNLLYFSLLGLGIGIKITTHSLKTYDKNTAVYVMLPGISCILICLSVNVIRLTHPVRYDLLGDDYKKTVKIVWVLRVLCLLSMVVVLCFYRWENHFIILGVFVISFLVQINVDVEGEIRNKEYKKDLKHEAHERKQKNKTAFFKRSYGHIVSKKNNLLAFKSVAGTL